MQPVRRKLAIGLAVLAGSVGVGAGLAAAQTDGTSPPTTQAPSNQAPSDQAPDGGGRNRDDKDCPEKANRDGGSTQGSSTNAVMRLSHDDI